MSWFWDENDDNNWVTGGGYEPLSPYQAYDPTTDYFGIHSSEAEKKRRLEEARKKEEAESKNKLQRAYATGIGRARDVIGEVGPMAAEVGGEALKGAASLYRTLLPFEFTEPAQRLAGSAADYLKEEAADSRAIAEDRRKAWEESYAPVDLMREGLGGQVLYGGVQAVPELAAQVAAGYATGSPLVPAALTGVNTMVEGFREGREADNSIGRSLAVAAPEGAATAGITKLGLDKVLSPIIGKLAKTPPQSWGQVLKAAGQGGVAESTEEASQELVAFVAEVARGRSVEDVLAEAPERMKLAAVASFAPGALVTGGGATARRQQNMSPLGPLPTPDQLPSLDDDAPSTPPGEPGDLLEGRGPVEVPRQRANVVKSKNTMETALNEAIETALKNGNVTEGDAAALIEEIKTAKQANTMSPLMAVRDKVLALPANDPEMVKAGAIETAQREKAVLEQQAAELKAKMDELQSRMGTPPVATEPAVEVETPQRRLADIPDEEVEAAWDTTADDLFEMIANTPGVSDEVRAAAQKLRVQATMDHMTRLRNQGQWLEDIKSAKTLVKADMDEFKGINDHFGHEAGDVALTQFSRIAGERAREAGFDLRVYRIGGDEFGMTSSLDANDPKLTEILEGLRGDFAKVKITNSRGESYNRLGFSFGIGTDLESAEQGLINDKQARADQGYRPPPPPAGQRGAFPQGIQRVDESGRVRGEPPTGREGDDNLAGREDLRDDVPAAPETAVDPRGELVTDGDPLPPGWETRRRPDGVEITYNPEGREAIPGPAAWEEAGLPVPTPVETAPKQAPQGRTSPVEPIGSREGTSTPAVESDGRVPPPPAPNTPALEFPAKTASAYGKLATTIGVGGVKKIANVDTVTVRGIGDYTLESRGKNTYEVFDPNRESLGVFPGKAALSKGKQGARGAIIEDVWRRQQQETQPQVEERVETTPEPVAKSRVVEEVPPSNVDTSFEARREAKITPEDPPLVKEALNLDPSARISEIDSDVRNVADSDDGDLELRALRDERARLGTRSPIDKLDYYYRKIYGVAQKIAGTDEKYFDPESREEKLFSYTRDMLLDLYGMPPEAELDRIFGEKDEAAARQYRPGLSDPDPEIVNELRRAVAGEVTDAELGYAPLNTMEIMRNIDREFGSPIGKVERSNVASELEERGVRPGRVSTEPDAVVDTDVEPETPRPAERSEAPPRGQDAKLGAEAKAAKDKIIPDEFVSEVDDVAQGPFRERDLQFNIDNLVETFFEKLGDRTPQENVIELVLDGLIGKFNETKTLLNRNGEEVTFKGEDTDPGRIAARLRAGIEEGIRPVLAERESSRQTSVVGDENAKFDKKVESLESQGYVRHKAGPYKSANKYLKNKVDELKGQGLKPVVASRLADGGKGEEFHIYVLPKKFGSRSKREASDTSGDDADTESSPRKPYSAPSLELKGDVTKLTKGNDPPVDPNSTEGRYARDHRAYDTPLEEDAPGGRLFRDFKAMIRPGIKPRDRINVLRRMSYNLFGRAVHENVRLWFSTEAAASRLALEADTAKAIRARLAREESIGKAAQQVLDADTPEKQATLHRDAMTVATKYVLSSFQSSMATVMNFGAMHYDPIDGTKQEVEGAIPGSKLLLGAANPTFRRDFSVLAAAYRDLDLAQREDSQISDDRVMDTLAYIDKVEAEYANQPAPKGFDGTYLDYLHFKMDEMRKFTWTSIIEPLIVIGRLSDQDAASIFMAGENYVPFFRVWEKLDATQADQMQAVVDKRNRGEQLTPNELELYVANEIEPHFVEDGKTESKGTGSGTVRKIGKWGLEGNPELKAGEGDGRLMDPYMAAIEKAVSVNRWVTLQNKKHQVLRAAAEVAYLPVTLKPTEPGDADLLKDPEAAQAKADENPESAVYQAIAAHSRKINAAQADGNKALMAATLRSMTESADTEFKVWEDGREFTFNAPRELVHSMGRMSPKNYGWVLQAFRNMSLFVQNAALVSLGFQTRQPIRDAPSIFAYSTSKKGLMHDIYKSLKDRDATALKNNIMAAHWPLVTHARGFLHILLDTDINRRAQAEGAPMAGLHEIDSDNWLQELTAEYSTQDLEGGDTRAADRRWRKFLAIYRHNHKMNKGEELSFKTLNPVGVIKDLNDAVTILGKYVDRAGRTGVYADDVKSGRTDAEAMVNARTGPMDFSVGGAIPQATAKYIPFFNVPWLEVTTAVTAARNNPVQFAVKMSILMGLAALTQAYIWDRAEDDEELADWLSRRTDMDRELRMPILDTDTGYLWSLPRPQGIVGASTYITERMLDKVLRDDPQAASEIFAQAAFTFGPQAGLIGWNSSKKAPEIELNMLPPLVKGIWEQATGKKAFLGRPLYGYGMEPGLGTDPALLYNDYTSATARATTDVLKSVAEKVGADPNNVMDPIQVQNFYDNMMPGIPGKAVQKGLDKVTELVKPEYAAKQRVGLPGSVHPYREAIPSGSRNRNTQELFDARDKANAEWENRSKAKDKGASNREASKYLGDLWRHRGMLNRGTQLVSKYADDRNRVRDDPSLTDEEKVERTMAINRAQDKAVEYYMDRLWKAGVWPKPMNYDDDIEESDTLRRGVTVN